jgi:penicillin-binding protein-related factor A (putative recombinase)
MKKHEAQFQTRLNSWLRNVYKKTCAFETKDTLGNTILFSRLEEHQKQWLLVAKHGTAVYKIPDAGFTNPFDGIVLAGVDAFVIVHFGNDREFYLIDIDVWCSQETKSLSRARAEEIASVVSYKLCTNCGKKMGMHKMKFCSDECQRKSPLE